MTLLGLFEGLSSNHGIGQYKGPNDRRPSHYRYDILNSESQSLNGSGINILPRPYQDSRSLNGTLPSLSHDKPIAELIKPTLFSTSSASSRASSSSSSSSSTNPIVSPESHIPSRPQFCNPTASSRSAGSKRKHMSSPPIILDADSEDAQAAIKRHRNTMAARKYRQKRLDRISDLEQALDEVTRERNALKLQLARREAEVDALREMLSKK